MVTASGGEHMANEDRTGDAALGAVELARSALEAFLRDLAARCRARSEETRRASRAGYLARPKER